MMLKLIFLFNFLSTLVYCSVNLTCPDGTVQYGNTYQWCYKFVNNSVPFTEADHSCVSLGGRLAEIDDQFTNNFLSTAAYTPFLPFSNFWIGGKLRSVQNANIWAWTRSNIFITYFDWSQPDAGTGASGDCISVSTDDGTWAPKNCTVSLPFVCQIPPSYRISECDSEWTYFALTDKCYKVFAQAAIKQATAESNCVSEGGHLVSIHSDDENNLVGQMTSTLYVGTWEQVGVHIGAFYDASSNLKWTDASAVDYVNWGRSSTGAGTSIASLYLADGATDSPYVTYVRQWTGSAYPNMVNRYVCKKNPSVINTASSPDVESPNQLEN